MVGKVTTQVQRMCSSAVAVIPERSSALNSDIVGYSYCIVSSV